MKKICDLSAIADIGNTAIRDLVQQRIKDLGGATFDAESLGYFLVIETGDSIEAIQAQLGFDVLCNRLTGIRYDQTGFTPSFEFIEEQSTCFDMVLIFSDDGFGVEMIVPKEGVDPHLIAMCQRYAFKSEDAP